MDYPHPVGERRDLPPLDMDLDLTTFVPAGAITIGVENRTITDDIIRQNYAGYEQADAIGEKIESALEKRGTSFDDGGMSIHVCDADSGHEYLRFDAFLKDPHYHYIFPDRSHVAVRIDESALGNALEWVLDTVTERTPQMLIAAGAPAQLAEKVDPEVLRAAMPKVRELAAG